MGSNFFQGVQLFPGGGGGGSDCLFPFNFYILRRKSNSLCLMNDFNFYHGVYHGVLNHFHKL